MRLLDNITSDERFNHDASFVRSESNSICTIDIFCRMFLLLSGSQHVPFPAKLRAFYICFGYLQLYKILSSTLVRIECEYFNARTVDAQTYDS